MYTLDKCNSDGQLKTDSQLTSIDFENGVFKFNNLKITSSGMYVLLISLKTTNGEYAFDCVSKSILVQQAQQAITINDDYPPGIVFKFSGNFSDHKSKLESYKTIFYNCIIEKYNITVSRSLSIYEGSIMLNTDGSGTASNLASMKEFIAAGFSLGDGVKLVSANLFDSEYIFDSGSANTANSISQKQSATEQVFTE